MGYEIGRAGKFLRKAMPTAISLFIAGLTVYEIYTGNINVAEEIGRVGALGGCVGVGGVASAIDLYGLRNW
jgi:hypothetical protein